ncbi:MAG: hypothetical protein ABH814_00955 [bacterium]
MRSKLVVTTLLGSALAAEIASGSAFSTPNVFASITTAITNPITNVITNPITDPVTNPVTNPVTSPITNPITDPVTTPITEPVTEPITAPVPIAKTFKISGRVTYVNTTKGPILVKVYLVDIKTGAVVKKTYTGFGGYYTFRKVKRGTYKVIPQNNRFTFLPASRVVVVRNQNITNQNFRAFFTKVVK